MMLIIFFLKKMALYWILRLLAVTKRTVAEGSTQGDLRCTFDTRKN